MGKEKPLQLPGQGANLGPGPQGDTSATRAHAVEPRHGVGAVLALDDGLPVQRVPVVELGVELDADDVQVARVVVPGEVAVHADHVHVGGLRGQHTPQRRVNIMKTAPPAGAPGWCTTPVKITFKTSNPSLIPEPDPTGRCRRSAVLRPFDP